MGRKKYHVTKTNNGWQGKLEKATRASVVGITKAQVLQKTIEIAKNNNNSQVFIHGANSKIQEERTYPRSIDPRQTKG